MTPSHFPAYTGHTAAAGQTVVAETAVGSVRTAGKLPSRRQGIGWICLALATALWIRVSAGASAIDRIISEYEGVMALAPRAPRLLAISAVAAGVVLVVQLVRFAEPIHQMTIITE